MNGTNCLLISILFILLKQFYPLIAEVFTVLTIGSLPFSAYNFLTTLRWKWNKQREDEDNRIFWEYKQKHDEITAKFDPKNDWNEGTTLPKDYKREILRLNLDYQGMLQRRNGWTVNDFHD